MWPFKSEKYKYQAVALNDVEVHEDDDANVAGTDNETKSTQLDSHARRNRYIAIAILLALLAGLFAFIILVFPRLAPYLAEPKANSESGPNKPSSSPYPVRREWRSLHAQISVPTSAQFSASSIRHPLSTPAAT